MREEPFHEGEIRVQDRAGERALAVRLGRMISGTIPESARPFLEDQGMLAVASIAPDGAPWASLLLGEQGLARTVDGTSVTIDRTRVGVDEADPLWKDVRLGAPLGLLAIDLATRSRLRVNGTISALTDTAIELAVREAFPNCPKYIQRRVPQGSADLAAVEGVSEGTTLDAARQRTIESADTMFVASAHPDRGADVSHRGGPRGFVRVLDPATLRVPDYGGNSLFNTLGNLAVTRRAGVVIPVFDHGRVLHLVGDVDLHFGVPEDPEQPTGGTTRYWVLHVSRWMERPVPAMLRWRFVDASPFNPPRRTGQGGPDDTTPRDG